MFLLAFFNQSFGSGDIAIIGLLIVLEGVLSIDNALVLGLLAKRLPKHQQKKALTYGLVGAFVFRLIAIALAAYLLKWWWVKLLGGGYLVFIAVKHLFFDKKPDDHVTTDDTGTPELRGAHGEVLTPEQEVAGLRARSPLPVGAASVAPLSQVGRKYPSFWLTVATIELTDIAFAIDSILAAIAMIPVTTITPNPKLWVVITGGMFGVILMRFAAVIFIRLLEKFPRFEQVAYYLVMLIGAKLLADWGFNKPPANHPLGESFHGPLDFHSIHSPAFWIFWGLMAALFVIGFMPSRKKPDDASARDGTAVSK